MRLPNLLATRRGRLTAFFLLYATEGIPLGFVGTAVATQLRRQDVGPAEIGALVGSFYLPWAFKWAFGPVIDVFASDRLGRRRGWILLTQVLMACTLLSTVVLRLPEQLQLFTIILLVHNTFGAMQDVAIDALACNTLQEDERGLANGTMFAGAYIGIMLGGSGVLFLTSNGVDFQWTFLFVVGCILLVTLFVVLPMKEPAQPARPSASDTRLSARVMSAGREMRSFVEVAFRSFLGSRGAFCGLFFALLPAGAMCLGLALQTNLAVELGMKDEQVAWLNAFSAVISASFCILGGALSDRFGRRAALFTYIALMGLPVLFLASVLQQYGWIFPVSANDRPPVPDALITAYWIAVLVYSMFNGLMYGTRSAAFMDVTNPAVAGTQFTAYMALMNVAIAYSATWQGVAIEAFGYPRTMLFDVLLGVVCLAFIPLMAKRPTGTRSFVDAAATLRARGVAYGLSLVCFAWLPYRIWQDSFGPLQPIAETFFTLVFVVAALFLLATAATIGGSARMLVRCGVVVAPLLLFMYARHYVEPIGRGFGVDTAHGTFASVIEIVLRAIPPAAGIVLLLLALQPWRELEPNAAPEPVAA